MQHDYTSNRKRFAVSCLYFAIKSRRYAFSRQTIPVIVLMRYRGSFTGRMLPTKRKIVAPVITADDTCPCFTRTSLKLKADGLVCIPRKQL